MTALRHDGPPPLTTRTRIVLVQHVLEQTEPSNTGRHAAAALARCELRVYGQKDVPLKVDDLAGAWLLWPGEPAIPEGTPPPDTLVVLDASWSQARKMVQRVPALRGLRRWSLPAAPDAPRLRAAPPGGMSTLESLARALEALEGPEAGRALDALHERLLDQQRRDRGYVGAGPR